MDLGEQPIGITKFLTCDILGQMLSILDMLLLGYNLSRGGMSSNSINI